MSRAPGKSHDHICTVLAYRLGGQSNQSRVGRLGEPLSHPGSVSHSQPAANSQPATTSPGQCTPRYTRLKATSAIMASAANSQPATAELLYGMP